MRATSTSTAPEDPLTISGGDATEDGPKQAACLRGARRLVVLSAGLVLTGIGILGIFLPVLPTTCFLLLAAWCFARSSPRLHRWLHRNRWFGEHLRRYRRAGTVSPGVKWSSVAFLWIGIGTSTLLFLSGLTWRLLLLGVAAGVTLHLVRLPTTSAAGGEVSP